MERWLPVLRCRALSGKDMRRCRIANDKNHVTQRLEMDGKILSTKHTATKQRSWVKSNHGNSNGEATEKRKPYL